MTAPGALYLPARAKLNLVLRVVGRRADGYHLLETLFHTLALHDDVAVARTAGGLTIDVAAAADRALAPANADNLAVRALAALQAAVGDRGGFAVRLFKRIPAGAGLGGGSSDAAAALRLGNALLGAPLAAGALASIAARLGADVPFFLRGGTQWGRGIGDELSPAAATAQHFVLVLPPFGCATAAVYKIHAALLQARAALDTVPSNSVPDPRDAVVSIRSCNDLEPAAESLQPELGRLRRAIVAAGYPDVRMSGSGSTLFVACADHGAAERCARALRARLAADVAVTATTSGPPLDADQPSATLPPTVRDGGGGAG